MSNLAKSLDVPMPSFTPETRLIGKPLGSRALVRPVLENDITTGGIIIPDVAKNRPEMGVVVAVGPGREVRRGDIVEFMPLNLSVGDLVLFSRYTGIDIEFNGEPMIVLTADDILMVVEEEESDG